MEARRPLISGGLRSLIRLPYVSTLDTVASASRRMRYTCPVVFGEISIGVQNWIVGVEQVLAGLA
jgi:hypothetical protein